MKQASPVFQIADRQIGTEFPTYVIAELSSNHGGDFDRALRLVRMAKECGADAVKLQTLPVPMRRATAAWCRAVVLEEK